MGAPRKIDWSVPREEFVTGPDTVTIWHLAEKHGVRRETMSRRKQAEDWDGQRAQYRHQVVTKAREKASSYEAQRLNTILNVAKAMRGLAMQQLEKLRAPRKVKIDGKEVEHPSRLESEMSTMEVRQWLLSAAALEEKAIGSEQEVEIRLRGELSVALEALRQGLSPEEYRKVLGILATVETSTPGA